MQTFKRVNRSELVDPKITFDGNSGLPTVTFIKHEIIAEKVIIVSPLDFVVRVSETILGPATSEFFSYQKEGRFLVVRSTDVDPKVEVLFLEDETQVYWRTERFVATEVL